MEMEGQGKMGRACRNCDAADENDDDGLMADPMPANNLVAELQHQLVVLVPVGKVSS